jgi:phosphatidylserine decarboxylase
VVNPPRLGRVREWRYDDVDIRFAQGDEMGRFLLGSTVVMLWPRNTARLDAAWHEAMPVRLGQKMAEATI